MRKPECTVVHEDFRIKRNAEITLLGHLPKKAASQKDRLFYFFIPPLLFCSFNGCFPEILHHLADVEGGFACPCAGSLVAFFHLSVSIGNENFDFGFDLVYKFFHCDKLLIVIHEIWVQVKHFFLKDMHIWLIILTKQSIFHNIAAFAR